MSDIDTLVALRPTAETSAAIQEAAQRIAAAILTADLKIDGLTELRRGLIATGTTEDIKTVQFKLEDARIWREQLDALRDVVAARLPVAIRQEKDQAHLALIADTNARTLAWNARMRAESRATVDALLSLIDDGEAACLRRTRVMQERHRDSALPADAPALIDMAFSLSNHRGENLRDLFGALRQFPVPVGE
jgi:hypothetical protein